MNSILTHLENYFLNAAFAALLFDTLLKSFVVLGLAAAVCAVWRRAAAATRHLIWFLAVASLPLLPLLNVAPQRWHQPLWNISAAPGVGNQIYLSLNFGSRPAAEITPAAPAVFAADSPVSTTVKKTSPFFKANWMLLGVSAWLAGAALVFSSIVIGQFRLHQFSRRAQPLDNLDWAQWLDEAGGSLQLHRAVKLLQSPDNVMPMTWGWRRPVILLPADADHWPAERRRVVLLHELAHVKRRDCLTQIAAQIVCALYWFNPLVWLAVRQMRVERELACDDLVLAGGCRASDYAGHLVAIAGQFRRVPLAAAIAMARSSPLHGRVAAIVDANRNRRLRAAAAILILALIGGIAVCIGGSGTSGAGDAAQADLLRLKQIGQLKNFSVQKEKQSRSLAAAAGEKILPVYEKIFTAASSGDWQAVTNMYESLKQRHPQYGKNGELREGALRTSYWGPVLEICLAYDHVVRCEPEFTQLAVDGIISSIPAGSIYFGGTDPGRGLPTAFCKSHADADPFYTLTQNALADGTYLDYLRNMYNDPSKLPGQIQGVSKAALLDQTDGLKLLLRELDEEQAKAQTNNDSDLRAVKVAELERKAMTLRSNLKYYQGVLEQEAALYIPTSTDAQRCFQDYVTDVTQRAQNKQLKPGEDFKSEGGAIQVGGQVAVMSINGLLAKIIFDKNPGREFFIEESFPLDWMYPHLEPHGLIFKINRQPLAALSDDAVKQDREYWQPRVTQMIGGWLQDDTPLADVTAFADKVFLRHDLGDFTGEKNFVQNDYATRMFSKWRTSIAGLYAWRAEHAAADLEKDRMASAADFAFRQALALCPYSPEAAKRYADFLKARHREADAALVTQLAETFQKAK